MIILCLIYVNSCHIGYRFINRFWTDVKKYYIKWYEWFIYQMIKPLFTLLRIRRRSKLWHCNTKNNVYQYREQKQQGRLIP